MSWLLALLAIGHLLLYGEKQGMGGRQVSTNPYHLQEALKASCLLHRHAVSKYQMHVDTKQNRYWIVSLLKVFMVRETRE